MKKKIKVLIVLLGITLYAGTVFASVGTKTGFAGVFAGETTGKWVHYAQKDAELGADGVREYWVRCGGGYQFTAPTGATIDEASSYDTTEFTAEDPRWIKYDGTVFYNLKNDSYDYREAPNHTTVTSESINKTPGNIEKKLIVEADKPAKQVEILTVTDIIDTFDEVKNFKSLGSLEVNTSATEYKQVGYFVFGADIECNNLLLAGNTAAGENFGFAGVVDGRGHAVHNPTIGNGGLVGQIAKGGVVKNLAVKGGSLGYSGGGGFFGLRNYGTIDNCLSECVDITSTYACCSGFCNLNYGTISNSLAYYVTNSQATGKAICQYNQTGGVLTNVYAATEDDTTYNAGGTGTVKKVAYNSTIAQIGLSGLNNYWDLSGARANLNKYRDYSRSNLPKDVFLDSADGKGYVDIVGELGLTPGTTTKVYEGSNELTVDITDNKITLTSLSAGEHSLDVEIDGKKYGFKVVVITKAIGSFADFTAARDANTAAGVWSGYYILKANVTMDQTTAYSSTVTSFTGTFDGRGFKFINGYFHSGPDDAKKSLFANCSGTVKNTAFMNTKLGIIAGPFRGCTGLIDNCLFEGTVLGDYADCCFIYSQSGHISNSMFKLVCPTTSAKNRGVISMWQGTTENVLVFATQSTGWDNRSVKTGMTLYAYSANLPAGLVGFNHYWNISGTQAAFKA